MGISFERDLRVAGYRPALFKNALDSYYRTKSPGNVVDRKSLFPQRRDGAIVFEECLGRRLIDLSARKLTEAGDAVVRAKAVRRTPLAKAKAALEELLVRVDDFNNDPEGVEFIEEAWLVGSLLREEDTVGDIDLALDLVRRPRFAKNIAAMDEHLDNLISRIPDAPERWDRPWSQERWFLNRSLFGKQRKPLFSGVQESLSNLACLAVPCRLIYDRKAGGRTLGPILPRHPKSNGRSSEMPPQVTTVDWAPDSIRPMDARWLAAYSPLGVVSPYDIFGSWNDDAHRLFSRFPKDLRIAGNDFRPFDERWLPKCLKLNDLDGRSSIALINSTFWSGTCLVLHRNMEICADRWQLNASIGAIELYRNRRRIDPDTLPELVAAAALVVAVDAERMLRRAAELPVVPRIHIEIGSHPNEALQSLFVEPLYGILQSRALRIEPLDWRGELATLSIV